MEQILNQLKTFNENALDLDQLVQLLAFATILHATYDDVAVDVPEWLDGQIRKLKRQIRTREADTIEKRIREKEARLEALKPVDKKRSELAAEIRALKTKQSKIA